jgi:hypothetical protein
LSAAAAASPSAPAIRVSPLIDHLSSPENHRLFSMGGFGAGGFDQQQTHGTSPSTTIHALGKRNHQEQQITQMMDTSEEHCVMDSSHASSPARRRSSAFLSCNQSGSSSPMFRSPHQHQLQQVKRLRYLSAGDFSASMNLDKSTAPFAQQQYAQQQQQQQQHHHHHHHHHEQQHVEPSEDPFQKHSSREHQHQHQQQQHQATEAHLQQPQGQQGNNFFPRSQQYQHALNPDQVQNEQTAAAKLRVAQQEYARKMVQAGLTPVGPQTIRDPRTGERLFSAQEVYLMLQRALSDQSDTLHLDFDRILCERLQEQWASFSKFNEDYVSRTPKPTDLSYIG